MHRLALSVRSLDGYAAGEDAADVTSWTPKQVLGLAPDASEAKAGRGSRRYGSGEFCARVSGIDAAVEGIEIGRVFNVDG